METITKGYYLKTSWDATDIINNICRRYNAKVTHIKIEYNYIYVEFSFLTKYIYKIKNELAPVM